MIFFKQPIVEHFFSIILYNLQLHSLKEKQKKTIIEPQHITATHRKIAPDLSEVIELAWGHQVDFSQEAIKELYFMLETYYRVKEVNTVMYFKDTNATTTHC